MGTARGQDVVAVRPATLAPEPSECQRPNYTGLSTRSTRVPETSFGKAGEWCHGVPAGAASTGASPDSSAVNVRRVRQCPHPIQGNTAMGEHQCPPVDSLAARAAESPRTPRYVTTSFDTRQVRSSPVTTQETKKPAPDAPSGSSPESGGRRLGCWGLSARLSSPRCRNGRRAE